ncbi:MAG: NHL repeat-containing protein [Acidobacteriia bacterium]|nr:NHL repeat-containing protein [Terriglobia bacterium]
MEKHTHITLKTRRVGNHQEIPERVVRVPRHTTVTLGRVTRDVCLYFAICLLLILQSASSNHAQTPIITTYAGPQLPTDGTSALTQSFDYPAAVIPDGAGGIYFADQIESRVYRVLPDGTLHLIAGSTYGFGGDAGPATSARLAHPTGLALDAQGDLYIADTLNDRIRVVAPSGVINTAVGTGIHGFSGDGGPATSAQLAYPCGVAFDSKGNLYIADMNNFRVRQVTVAGVIVTVAGTGSMSFGGDGGPATSAALSFPYAVAVDSAGNLFIADSGNSRIRKVTPGGVISTVAGSGTQGLEGDSGPAISAHLFIPHGVAVDAQGNIYIADTLNPHIRRVTPDGLINVYAGAASIGFSGDGGLASLAQLNEPNGVAVDAAGNLLIADAGNSRIRRVTPGGIINTVAGAGTYGFGGDNGPASSAHLYFPTGVVSDAVGNIYVSDSYNQRIRKITPAGVITTVAGSGVAGFAGDGGSATSARLNYPGAVTLDAAGNLFISDTNNHRVRKVTPSGVINTVAGNGTFGFSGDGGPAISAQLYLPHGLATDATGNLYIADWANYRVRKVTLAGTISTFAGIGTLGFTGDGGPATLAQLGPIGLALDNGANFYIADEGNFRVRKITPGGVINTVAGTWAGPPEAEGVPATSAGLAVVSGVAVDAAGNFYIADSGLQRISKVTPAGLINTVTGNRVNGFSGDGGSALSGQLNNPNGVAVDPWGNLYIADTYNHRIRKITLGPRQSFDLALSAGGDVEALTLGHAGPVQAGYALVTLNSGNPPYGTAVLALTQNGVVVSEVGVPASPPTTAARLFVEYRTNIAAKSTGVDAGVVSTNTGLALANLSNTTSRVNFTVRDRKGNTVARGDGFLGGFSHAALFISELNRYTSALVLPPDFATNPDLQFGTLEVLSTEPLSIAALRLTINQRGETLMTTTPIVDESKIVDSNSLYLPQFADGGGLKSAYFLMNRTHLTQSGQLSFFDNLGNPLGVNLLSNGSSTASGNTFPYSIPPGGAFIFQSLGSSATIQVGSAEVNPDPGTSAPAGGGIFDITSGGTMVSESGIPTALLTTHARVYIDQSNGHRTGIAVAAPSTGGAFLTLTAYQPDGIIQVGNSIHINLPLGGHTAMFVDELFSGLPAAFTGVLDISSFQPFVALTLRSLTNARGDTLLTTFPIADFNQTPVSPIVFPQIADGGGFQTQFIFLNTTGGASSVTVNFSGDDGSPIAIGKSERLR